MKIQILNQSGFPISDVSLGHRRLIKPHPGMSAEEYWLPTVGYVTNEEGKHFLPVPPGEWQFYFSHESFGLVYINIIIEADAITERTIVLIPVIVEKSN